VIDWSKLPSAPWEVVQDAEGFHYIPRHGRFPLLLPETETEGDIAALEFAALARNAEDVMTRRGWGVVRVRGQWLVAIGSMEPLYELRERLWSHPFLALVEADAWYAEQVEGRRP
jgi:hypothetical protein